MRPSFMRVDVVYIRVDILVVARVVVHRDLNRYTVSFAFHRHHFRHNHFAIRINVFDKACQSVFTVEALSYKLAFSSFSRRSVSVIEIPLFKKASSRMRFAKMSYWYSSSSKISASGLKVTMVPR